MSIYDAPHETKVTVRGSARGFAQEISARSHRLVADEPIPNGGTDTGPTPYDLLVAALGMCIDDGLAVRATKRVAAGGSDRSPPTFQDSCGRLRGMRDKDGAARSGRVDASIPRTSPLSTTSAIARDRTDVSRPSHATIRGSHSGTERCRRRVVRRGFIET
jgi:hypothetical protein